MSTFCYDQRMANTEIKAHIEKTAAGGAGLARINGKTVFIEGSAPGETVLCRIISEHQSWSQAELTEIIDPSPDRVQPACGHYGKCGGCNMQHLNYPAQIAVKTAVLKDTFTRIGGFSPPEPLIFPSNPWKYRNRMQFHITKPEPESPWGLKARKKSDIIPIFDCPIADPGIQSILQAQKKQPQRLFSPENIQYSPQMSNRFTVYARNGLFLHENRISRGKTHILNRELVLDAGIFFQSNGAMLETLLQDLSCIAAALTPAGRTPALADLYCGVGTLSAFLGELFSHIDLIEENTDALVLARENLRSFNSTAFFAQRSEDWAKTGLKTHRYSLIIVDPPRQGLKAALAHQLAADGPPVLLYISCDPATLARDSALLLKGGYRLQELRWYDFYPQTAHMESLAVFTR